MADHAVSQNRGPGLYRKVIAFASLHADYTAPYRKMLDDWLRSGANYHLYSMVSDTPEHWTGSTAFLRPGVSGQWFWLNDAFYELWYAGEEKSPEALRSLNALLAETAAQACPPEGS